jgi:Cu/Ag efflux pump CusA
MSIPKIAIERPVTMFMISMVIILLGAISLTRLPVDLMPDTQMPTITVRVNYAGVGPLEMEELVTRPIEQAVSAVASTACAAACRKTPIRRRCSSSTRPRCRSWASASKATSTR